MKKYILQILVLMSILHVIPSFSWNGVGHKLVAEIAYQHMTTHAKATFNHFNHALDKVYKPQTFVNSATWLDELRHHEVSWFTAMHYIGLPFAADNSQAPPLVAINGVWGVEEAIRILQNKKANSFEKGISLRVLEHVVGDLHQPLHAVNRVSRLFPTGDQGGNLVKLGKNAVATNLHAYWDRGGGLLLKQGSFNDEEIRAFASNITQRWPCRIKSKDKIPMHWAEESRDLAISKAYKINMGDIPDDSYQRTTQKIAEQRIALAGCRLSNILNSIDDDLNSKKKG